MLEIFNNLQPFFEDVYREFSVREYARLVGLSPPTASKILKDLTKQEILIFNNKGLYLFFRANRESALFKDLSIAYWRNKLALALKDIHKDLLFKKVILFGSIAKTENTADSDVDIYVDIPRKNIELSSIEKKLQRKIQIHFNEASKNAHLYKNINSGFVIL